MACGQPWWPQRFCCLKFPTALKAQEPRYRSLILKENLNAGAQIKLHLQ
jgi:hypothetical protein